MSQTPEQALYELTHTSEFAQRPDTLTLSERVEAYAVAHFTEEVAKRRREELRGQLLDDAQKLGSKTDKGGNRLYVGDHTVVRERRVASAPDEKKLIALLEKKGLPTEAAFDRVTVIQPNASKVRDLVENGHLTEDEAKALFKESYALIVISSEHKTDTLNESIPTSLRGEKDSRK